MPQPYKSVPIVIDGSDSCTPSMLVNAKKYLKDQPQLIDCPRCKFHGETTLRHVSGLGSWLTFMMILLCGILVLPLFFLWVPFCVDAFRDVQHYCPNCNAWIGTYRRVGRST